MFTILSKEEMIEKIDSGLKGSLEDLLVIFPTIREKIIQTLLWGVFSENKPFKTEESTQGYYENFALVSYDIIELAKEKLKKSGVENTQFFVSFVDSDFRKNDFLIGINYEDYDIKIEKVSQISKVMTNDYKGIIASTLADSSVVFESFIKGDLYHDSNLWLLEYLDKYDMWKHEIMENLYNYRWQIGGHGRWIQTDYNNTYLAQINIDIGDAGSIFIECDNGKIKGGIDMF